MHALSILSLATLALAVPAKLKLRDEPAPLMLPQSNNPQAKVIPGKYLIKLKDSVNVASVASAHEPLHVYKSEGFKGFAAKLSDSALDDLRNHPDVEYIEQDQVITMFDKVSQDNAPWGIARISHPSKDGSTNYVYDSSAGEGTCVYIIDTGIKIDHEEFEGRAEWLQNFTDDGHDGDGAGHGTWVAGLVGSRSYGVAKKAKLFALKVFRDDGTADGAGIIAAMDRVAQEASTRDCPKGHIANMSLGGGFSQTSNDAADAMVNAGVFVAVAAGNSNEDAAQTSPASAPLVCTVGASDESDARASFSSYGSVVDTWAPGVNLLSTSYQGGSTAASGTSGSSPLIAGLGAYLMAFEGLAGGEGVCNRIKELAIQGILTDIPSGTANQLAYNGASS